MKTDDNNIIGHVTECYNHDENHCVLTVIVNDNPWSYHFFYIPKTPDVNFGDIIQMNFEKQQFYVFKGNSRLSYKISPQVFPGTLLVELIQERMNQPPQD
jgi:hypothetical protein